RVLEELLCEEILLDQRQKDSDRQCSSIAFQSKVKFRKPRQNFTPKPAPPPKAKARKVQCTKCNKFGHSAAKCWTGKKGKEVAANAEVSSFLDEANNTEASNSNAWVFDTAASAHFSGDRSLFQNFKKVNDREVSVAVGDTNFPIEGIGDVKLTFPDNAKVTLKEVLYAPNIRRNLIAGSKFDRAKCKFIGEKGKLNVYSPTGERRLPFGENQKKNLQKYKWSQIESSIRASPLGLMWKAVVYPLKDKTGVFDCFTKFQSRAERFLNSKILNLRTDNGLEYVHKEFKSFLEKQGIHAERTNVATPQQNGVAERYNLTSLDAVKAMLSDSGVKTTFWSEALLCFTYTWNRVCHGGQTRTPFELYGGKTPSVNHLEIFGSKAYVAIPKQNRSKLEMRAKEGVMVGYAMQTRGYRVWLPSEHKVVETSHVKFVSKPPKNSEGQEIELNPPLANVGTSDLNPPLSNVTNSQIFSFHDDSSSSEDEEGTHPDHKPLATEHKSKD
ncbi:copia-like retrotransposable protein, partial [Lasius niger]